jgi:5-oxoprolinase (ATP-hydrolysing) subunit A
MGEGIGNDSLIMPFIDAANIACGYHAGDEVSIRHTMELCIKHKVKAGAHPSYYDKVDFGRKEQNLSLEEIYELVTQQLIIFTEVAETYDLPLHHVKPHGALYNQSAKDPEIGRIIAKAVKDFDTNVILYGLSGSHSIEEAKKIGLKTASEVFADRTYQDDGLLTSRKEPNALIEDVEEMVKHVREMVSEGIVTSVSGKKIPIVAETVCVHGDSKMAVRFVEALQLLRL